MSAGRVVPSWVAVALWATVLLAGVAGGYVVRDLLADREPMVARYYVDDKEVTVAGERRPIVSVRYIDAYEQARVMQFDKREDAEAFIAGYLGGRR